MKYEKGNWLQVKDPRSLDRRGEDMYAVPSEEQLQALADRLIGFGLSPWEVEVLVQRDVLKLTLKEIADQGGYIGAGAVLRIYNMAVAKAKTAYERVGIDA